MQLSPLQLRKYVINALTLRAVDGYDTANPQAGAITLRVTDLAHGNTEREKWKVGLSVALHESDEGVEPPYLMEVEIEGYFDFLDLSADEDHAAALVLVNGGGLLYSAVREHVWTLTSRGRWSAFVLPTLDLRDLREGLVRAEVLAAGDEPAAQTSP